MTKDDILKMAKEADLPNNYRTGEINNLNPLERFANLVAAYEREACAQLVDDIQIRCIGKDVDDPPLEHVSAAIRSRSQS